MDLDMRINGKTIITGLIGNPVGHTVSPFIHNSLFSALGINGAYLAFQVPENELADAVNGLKALGFAGFNVTIPYKEAVLAFLDGVNEEAKLYGAVNTIKISGGMLLGYNTDGYGFLRSFREETGTGLRGKTVCILGAGGTARTLAVKIATEKAEKIFIINRTGSRAKDIASYVNTLPAVAGGRKDVACTAEPGSPEAFEMMRKCDVIINATSVGMHPNDGESPVGEDFPFREGQIVYDVVYNPPRTRLMAIAESKGCRTANGAGMLFHQGLKAFEIWMELKVGEDMAKSLLSEFLKYLGCLKGICN